MLKRSVYLVIASLTALTLCSCMVAESKYLKKVEEADSLTKDFSEIGRAHV